MKWGLVFTPQQQAQKQPAEELRGAVTTPGGIADPEGAKGRAGAGLGPAEKPADKNMERLTPEYLFKRQKNKDKTCENLSYNFTLFAKRSVFTTKKCFN